MNPFINLLLRAGLTIGLHDREAFIDKFSQLLKDKVRNPEDLEKLGESLLEGMESYKNQLALEQLLAGASQQGNKELTKSIGELTKAVQELSLILKNQQSK
jgi:hypothetical protein